MLSKVQSISVILFLLIPLFSSFITGGPGYGLHFYGQGEFAIFSNFSFGVGDHTTNTFTFELWMRSFSWQTIFTPFSYSLPYDPMSVYWQGLSHVHLFGIEVPLSKVSYQTIYGTAPTDSTPPKNTTNVTPDPTKRVMGDWYNNTKEPEPEGSGEDGDEGGSEAFSNGSGGYPTPPQMWVMYQIVTEGQLALWHHYALVWNAGYFFMYLDGSPWVTAYFPTAANFTFDDGGILVLGQLQSNYGGESFSTKSSFIGTMDEIRIWNSAQSQQDILQNMHQSFGIIYGNQIPPENLVSCWSFDNSFFAAPTINNVHPYEVYDGMRLNVGTLGLFHETSGSTQILLGPAVINSVIIGVSQAYVIAENVPTVFIFSTITSMKITFPWLPDSPGENVGHIIANILASSLPSFGNISKLTKNGTSLITTTEDGTNVGSYIIFDTIPLLAQPERFPFSLYYTLYNNVTGISRNGTFLLQFNLAPIAMSYSMDAFNGLDMLVGLLCFDYNGDNLTTTIESPLNGILYQVETDEPYLGFRYRTDPITPSSPVVTHPSNIVAFLPLPSMRQDTISFTCSDEYSTSMSGTISLYVHPVEPTPLSGTSLWALDYNGLDSFASFVTPVNASVLLQSTFSILFWVNIRHTPNNTQQDSILPEVNPDRNQTLVSLVYYSRSLSVVVSSTNGQYRLRLVQTSGTNNTEEVLDTAYFVVPDLWHHLAVAVDNTVPVAFFYVDGVLITDLKMSAPFLLVRTILVGAPPDQNGDNYFNGQLDELKIWNTLFTSADYSQEIATKAVPKEGDPLIFYWDFNEGSQQYSVDLKNHSVLLLGGGNPLAYPTWVPSGVPEFVQWTTEENTPLVIYLDQARTSTPGVVFISRLPTNGTLYQYQVNGTVISSPYSPFVSFIPISQWVSGIHNYSSYDSVYIPENLIGPPSLYNPVYPFYGDSPLTWSPSLLCNIENLEFVEIIFEKEVYPMSVEVYESFNPGATDSILAWNDITLSWVVLYQENKPRLVPPLYNIFSPLLCEPVFKTNLYRVQFNTCNVDGWTQIDAIRVIGSEVPREGMVTDPLGRIFYYPSPNNSGSPLDTFDYSTSTCANSPRVSLPTTMYLNVLTNNNEDIHNMVVHGEENNDILILFTLGSSDGQVSQVLILSEPQHGTLYDLLPNNQIGEKMDTDSLSTQPKLLYRPVMNDCGSKFDSFRYAASDGKTKSNGSTVVININCAPGAHIYSLELVFVVSIISSSCILLCFCLLAWVYKERNHKFMWTNDPVFFCLLLSGNILCYISVYFYIIIMTAALCALRMWFTTIGYMIINGCHYARVYAMWRMFCNKVFKRKNVSQKNLMLIFGIFCGGQIVLLILFTLISPPIIIQQIDPIDPDKTQVICSYSLPFVWAIIIYEFLMLCVTCFFCFLLSKLDLHVVGSVAMYTLLAFSLACLPIFFLLDPVQMETQWIFPFCNIGTLIIPLLLIFIPKIIALKTATEGANLVQIGHSVLNMNDYDPSPSANRKTAVEMEKRNPVPKTGDTDPTGERSPQQMQEEIQQHLETIMTLENKLLKRKGQIKALEKKMQDMEG